MDKSELPVYLANPVNLLHAHMPPDDEHDDEHDHAIVCDRPSAREARRILRTVLEPYAHSLGATLSPSCPLSAQSDHLLPHEALKHAMTQHQWRCNKCSKLFKSEHYIDLHLERKHPELLRNTSAESCLGEFCDLLQCPSWVNRLRHEAQMRPRPCKPGELDARRHFCQHLMHDCFLPDGGSGGSDSHQMFEAIADRVCTPVSCAGRQLILESDGAALLVDPHAAAAAAAAPGAGYYILATLLILAVAAGLGVTLCSYGEALGARSGDAELRARRRRRGGGVFDALGMGKSKSF